MKHKILIIEDDPTIQTQLKSLLSYNGYEVEAVTDFSKVMEQLKAFAPHLVHGAVKGFCTSFSPVGYKTAGKQRF